MSDLVAKTADALALTSRNFYENSVFKLFLSFVWSAIGLFFLGLCAASMGLHDYFYFATNDFRNIDGGLSQYATNMNNQDGLSDDLSNKYKDQEVGYGEQSCNFCLPMLPLFARICCIFLLLCVCYYDRSRISHQPRRKWVCQTL